MGVILEKVGGTNTEVLMEEVVRRGQPLDVLGKTDLIRLVMDWMRAVREGRQAGTEVYSPESRGMGFLLVQMRSLLKEQFWGMRRVFICGGCIQF